jgi:Flp pilus assembly protein TadG
MKSKPVRPSPFPAPASARRGARGQSLTEMAIGLTVVLILLAGLIDLGRLYFMYLALKDAAAEGAAYGSLAPSDTAGIGARVRGESPDGLIDWTDAVVTATVIGQACRGGGIRVDVEVDYRLITPFLGSIVGSQVLPLKASVVDTILSPACP